MDSDNLRITRWGTINCDYLGPAFNSVFRKGQILYGSRRTYLRKVAIAPFDGICANTTFVIEANSDRILPDLLPFVMQSEAFTDHSVRMSRGSTNPYITWSDIAGFEFLIPDFDHQRRIADLLWAVEDCIIEHETMLEKITHAKRILMREWFSCWSGQPYQSNTSRGSDTKGRITKAIGELCESSAYGPRFSNSEYDSNGNIALLRTTDISDEGVINYQTMPLVSLDIEEFKNHYLKRNDLVITRSGTCGIAAIFEDFDYPVLPGAFLIRFRFTQDVNVEFIKTFLNSEAGRNRLRTLEKGGVQKNLSGSDLLAMRIPYPSDDSQRTISSLAQSVERAINETNESLKRTLSLKNRMLSKFIGSL